MLGKPVPGVKNRRHVVDGRPARRYIQDALTPCLVEVPPMKLLRVSLAVLTLIGVTALAVVTRNAESPGDRMVAAGDKFLASLKADQKAKAVFDFNDKERFNWNFVPLQTKDRKST